MIKKYLIYILVCTLVFPLGLLAKEKRGIDLVVQTKDEQIFRGELITVKEHSLLLLSDEGADVAVDIGEITNLTIVKKSKFEAGFGYGALVGGGAMTVALLASLESGDIESTASGFIFVGVTVLVGAAIGGAVGGVVGAVSGTDKNFDVDAMTDTEIQEMLDHLRSKARVTDYN